MSKEFDEDFTLGDLQAWERKKERYDIPDWVEPQKQKPIKREKQITSMKYFIDTEFIEAFHKPMFGKRRHFIDLISIGIVSEDGREYYAVGNEFNPKDADKWVRENVISKLPLRRISQHDSPRLRREALAWRSNKMIKQDLIEFFGIQYDDEAPGYYAPEGIEIYGYYADYDWVLFCSLFGRMIDLPGNFPMYCRDMKQMLDEKLQSLNQLKIKMWNVQYDKNPDGSIITGSIKPWTNLPDKVVDITKLSLPEKLELLKAQPEYPKQLNEHNALADAKWNMALYNFLQTF